MHKFQMQKSLVAVNVIALTLFVVGVAVIVHTEEPVASAAEPRPAVRGEVVIAEGGIVLRDLVAPEQPRACESKGKECSERTIYAPILFAFLAGGIMNLPELTSLPCI